MSSGSSIIIRYRSPSRINAMGQTKALARTARTAGPLLTAASSPRNGRKNASLRLVL